MSKIESNHAATQGTERRLPQNQISFESLAIGEQFFDGESGEYWEKVSATEGELRSGSNHGADSNRSAFRSDEMVERGGKVQQTMSFEDWVAGVEREVGSDVDGESYRQFYDHGLSPSEAVLQDRQGDGVLIGKLPETLYTTINGKMSAEEAADSLVSHASKIADAIKRRDNCFFEKRVTSINALLDLLAQYVQQERQAEPSSN
ncbi:hypothetical protein [Burkholderia sp. Ac-20365]|uniref:hypothetical protein n=1 Tax=Burkholderia sp. Ac-20365 TaxID=2703897 RepID=UPI00197BDD62|nr:hypothetical protein [Burkholderia sp. Ac-20365]MBN3761304.1 hypothetical protein [Burkholderia sp. Ac-20365]